jgi:PKD repeat protein
MALKLALSLGPMIRWLALIFWLLSGALHAQTIPAARAVETAWGVMGGHQGSLKSGLVQDSLIMIGDPDLPGAMVVTFKPAGFVIVSAQETASPVLGYSLTSAFPADPGHPLLSWLLPSYEKRISVPGRKKNGQNSKFFTDQMVLPLTTAQWGQGDPWNLYCPADSSGKRALAGCVAVAMSQIMEKWHWPLKGTGEIAYTPIQNTHYGEIMANFDTTRYRWDQTHDTDPTEASALILYHSGVATFMNYDPELSSTSVDRFAVPALIFNFSYNRGMTFRDLAGHDLPEWIRMLHQELDNNRPVLYAGTSPDGKSSHAFNIDGYRNDTYFHFNWGWNGAGDGWYTLNGMAGGGADFSTWQGAIFGIQPSTMPLHDRPSAVDALPGDGFIQLFWDQPVITDFSHFSIFRDGNLIGQTADTKFRDEGIENRKNYVYAITASYQGENPGESAATPELTAAPWDRIGAGYAQAFENHPEGWLLEGGQLGFQVGPAADFQIEGNTGGIAAIRSEGHPAGEQVADYLISPVFYPGNYSHPAVSFDYVFRQNAGVDHLSLMWRDFETGQWNTLAVLDSTGGYSDWENRHFYLPQLSAGQPIQIAFYYNDAFGQGYGAAIDNFTIYEVAQPAVPGFAVESRDVCLEQAVTFNDVSAGTIHTWEWDFGEGAEPRYAQTPGPHQVSYAIPGEKTVKLSLNHLDHISIPAALTIREKPVAAFQFTRRFQDILFTDKSGSAEQLLWLFGDGTSSAERNPVHTYYSKQLFEVRQIAFNGPCSPDTLLVLIDMRNGTGIEQEESGNRYRVFPNPATGNVTLAWDQMPDNDLTIRVLSISGQTLLHRKYPPQNEITFDISDFQDGIYILHISSGRLNRREQLLKITN